MSAGLKARRYMDEEISCEKKQGYDVISSAEATLGDEETSDIKSKPGRDGQVLGEPVLWFGYTWASGACIAGLAQAVCWLLRGTITSERGERLRRTLTLILAGGLLCLSATPSDAQILHKKRKKVNKSTSADNSAEPDKILYSRALDDIKHGRQEVGRLGLQTLINTYPDSEYLAKAKLGIADSYYKEAGTPNMTQAIQGYKDFIVFFPFLKEAGYAQLQVANAHYQQMAKPDRDRTEAKAAEEEYQTFLAKYPKDPLAPKAEQRRRGCSRSPNAIRSTAGLTKCCGCSATFSRRASTKKWRRFTTGRL